MSVPFKYRLNGVKTAIDAVTSRFLALFGGNDDQNWSARSLLRVPLKAASGAGGVVSIANPFGRSVILGQAFLDRTAGTTGTLDIGVAANGTTASATIFDDAAATATLFDNITDKGVGGLTRQRWGATQFVTGTASVAPTGLVGFLYLEVIDP